MTIFESTKPRVSMVGASNTVGMINHCPCVDMFIATEGWTVRDQYYGFLKHIDKTDILVINPDGNGTIEHHMKYVQGMVDIANAKKIKVILLSVGPRSASEPENPIMNKFNRQHKAQNFTGVDEYVDIRPALIGFVVGRHWNLKGKERVAALICEAVKKVSGI